MGRPCASCSHPRREEIDRKLKAGVAFIDVSRWLDAIEAKAITAQSIGSHAKDHLNVTPVVGRRPVSGDFLKDVVASAAEAVALGMTVTVKEGIAAQKALDARAARDLDRDIWAKVTLALTGRVSLKQLPDPEIEAVEAEFRELLSPKEIPASTTP